MNKTRTTQFIVGIMLLMVLLSACAGAQPAPAGTIIMWSSPSSVICSDESVKGYQSLGGNKRAILYQYGREFEGWLSYEGGSLMIQKNWKITSIRLIEGQEYTFEIPIKVRTDHDQIEILRIIGFVCGEILFFTDTTPFIIG